MNQNNKRKYLLVLGPLLLVIALIGITYAFFNYTRTGSSNRISVGRISFTTSQDNTINLTNVFPISSNKLGTDIDNHDTITINITGDTTYSEGIEYKVTLVQVNNTINNKEIPISFNVTATDLGTKSNDYWNDRGSTTNVYNLVESGEAHDNELVLIGYIKPDQVGVDGSIDITAYIDSERVGISDTVSRIENNNLIYGETDAEWIAGRTILTTTEWNSISSSPITFKVKVEANEGIWVEEEKQYVLSNLYNNSNWTSIRDNITSIEFHKDGVAPQNPITSFDVTDISSYGPVTLYTIDDGLGNNTYKAIIVADDVIYSPVDSSYLFARISNLEIFNSENFKVDNTTIFGGMFGLCSKLYDINSLYKWDTSNVTTMAAMFYGCASLENLDDLINWDTSNVTEMYQMFRGCTSLKNINGLTNWNTANVTRMDYMFGNCNNLENVNGLLNWNTTNVTNMLDMFGSCSKLTNIDLSSFDMSNVTIDRAMFESAGFRTIIMPNNYTTIDNGMFNHNAYYEGESFTIPKSVTTIGNSHIFYDFGKDNIFKKFIVESGGTTLKTIDDILYTYDGTRLIAVPRGKTFANNTFELPEGVTFLNELSFSRNQNIDTLVLPNSYVIERFIDESNNSYGFINSGNSLSVAIYLYTSIKMYDVKNDNTRYRSDSGCIYSKDGTELIAVPLHYEGVLNIKAGTTTIGQEAFWTVSDVSNVDSITQINIPASVTSIESEQLTFLNSLMKRSTNPVTITIDSGNTAYQIVNNQIVAR